MTAPGQFHSFIRRRDVLDELVTLHNFSNQFLPNALREFFRHIHAPEERGEYLETLITKFSHRFCACNPALVRDLGLNPGKYFCTFVPCSLGSIEQRFVLLVARMKYEQSCTGLGGG